MYKIIGADGKEYGPVGLEQLKQWVSQGRVNPQTRVQLAGAAEWKSAAEFPELSALFSLPPGAGMAPPPLSAPAGGTPESGLAITSFVLGLLSILCLGILAGIPAIITGHIAHNRSRRLPAQYGGSGFAIAGFVLGYVSIALTVLMAALLLPALARAKYRAQSTLCSNHMRQVGLAFKTWALDHAEQYPFNVSTNAGGTEELCARGADGFDRNAYLHFMVMSNELANPGILVCPADTSKHRAMDFPSLQAANVSYQLHSGTNYNETEPQAVLAVCPLHGNQLRCDGSVMPTRGGRWYSQRNPPGM